MRLKLIQPKKKVEYEDIFENSDKVKDTENDENCTKMNRQLIAAEPFILENLQ